MVELYITTAPKQYKKTLFYHEQDMFLTNMMMMATQACAKIC